jgi:hypothetical protein
MTALTYTVNTLPGGAIERLTAAILYVCSACETDAAFGVTRLNKTLFEADFLSFRTRGIPITGARYQRLQRGPAPKAMPHRLREMQEHGVLYVRKQDFLGQLQHKPIALGRPDLSLFSGEDIAILDSVIREADGRTAAEASEASHRIEWRTRQNGDDIPYEAAWLSDEPPTEADVERTRVLAAEHGWD